MFSPANAVIYMHFTNAVTLTDLFALEADKRQRLIWSLVLVKSTSKKQKLNISLYNTNESIYMNLTHNKAVLFFLNLCPYTTCPLESPWGSTKNEANSHFHRPSCLMTVTEVYQKVLAGPQASSAEKPSQWAHRVSSCLAPDTGPSPSTVATVHPPPVQANIMRDSCVSQLIRLNVGFYIMQRCKSLPHPPYNVYHHHQQNCNESLIQE